MAAGAHIRIDQATNPVPTGTYDQGRDDIRQAVQVQLVGDSVGNASPQWTLLDKPPGATASLAGASTFNATVTGDKAGPYRAQLLVNDGLSANGQIKVFRVTFDANGNAIDDGISSPAYGELASEGNAGGNARGYALQYEAMLAATVPAVASLTALRARVPNKHKRVRVLGVRGGSFAWNAASTTADNDGTVFAPTGVATGRWEREQVNNTFEAKWFGLAPTASAATNTTALVNAAAAANASGNGTVRLPAGAFTVTIPTPKFTSYSNVSFIGEGRTATMLIANGSAFSAWPSTDPGAGSPYGFFTFYSATNCHVRDIGFKGAGIWPPVALGTVYDRKGIMFRDSVRCSVTDCYFESIEGEVTYADGSVSVDEIHFDRNQYKNCISNLGNIGIGNGVGRNCSWNDNDVEGVFFSAYQAGGYNCQALRNRIRPGVSQPVLSADMFMCLNTVGHRIEDNEIYDFDLTGSGVSAIVVGDFGQGSVPTRHVSVRRNKILRCKFFASDTCGPINVSNRIGGSVIEDINIEDNTVADCGVGTQPAIAAVNVTGSQINGVINIGRNTIINGTGNTGIGVRISPTVPVANKIRISPNAIAADVAVPYAFHVMPAAQPRAGTDALSATDTPSRNVSGTATITDPATSVAVTLPAAESDSLYQVQITPYIVSAAPAAGSLRPSYSAKSVTGFTINQEAAAGGSKVVGFDWAISRGAVDLGTTLPFTALFDYIADVGNVTKDGSDRVATWNDGGSGTNHAIQGTAANKPIWQATQTPNGKAAIFFGTDTVRTLQSTSNMTLGAFTIYSVHKVAGGIVYEHGPNIGSTDGCYLEQGGLHTATRTPSGLVIDQKRMPSLPYVWIVTAHVFNGTDASHKLYLLGSDLQSTSLGTAGIPGAPGTGNAVQKLNLGNRANLTNFCNGWIRRVCGEAAAHSHDTIIRTMKILRAEAGI